MDESGLMSADDLDCVRCRGGGCEWCGDTGKKRLRFLRYGQPAHDAELVVLHAADYEEWRCSHLQERDALNDHIAYLERELRDERRRGR
jgi:hypothetical protein